LMSNAGQTNLAFVMAGLELGIHVFPAPKT
jgi:hypothetical protein